MKGLELCEKFYYQYGEPMIKQNFADVEQYLAIGLIGSGSECYGFDDEISQDHDFEPGFCIFLPDEKIVDTKTEFALERAYAKLPKEFLSFKRSKLNPVGGNRHGVIRIGDFLKSKTGNANAELSTYDWFNVSEQFLLEATTGKIFCDNFGKMTEIRKEISYLPEDVRLKKLAGNLLIMAQSGQYNYMRCIKRKETAAAQLAVGEFVNAALRSIFLLNKKYIPYYKWTFRALKDLQILGDLYTDLEYLISSSNTINEVEKKVQIIEKICTKITQELQLQNLVGNGIVNLEAQAYEVNNCIKDANARNLNIFCAV